MAKKVVIIDTCVLCAWLAIPGHDNIATPLLTADSQVIEIKVHQWSAQNIPIVLPFATIVETGNHITHVSDKNIRAGLVAKFSKMILDSLDGTKPWHPFLSHSEIYTEYKIREMVGHWNMWGKDGLALGDCSIKQIAEFYAERGVDVEIYTGDGFLKSLQPAPQPEIGLPRNRNRR